MTGPPPNVGWSDRAPMPTVPVVAGEDAERRAFRRRLGVTLSRVRTRLTSYTQETIAQELGVDVETVGRWERGDREPKTFELHRLAVKYDAPGEWFLFPTDSMTELDLRIESRRDVQNAALGVTGAQSDLARERARPPAAAKRRVVQRDKRSA
jgi:transcriptional regulator with XRE-family HTH domain